MRRVSVWFAAAATVAVLVGAPSASAEETLAASCPLPAEDSNNTGPGEFVAQTFTPGVSGTLTRAEIPVFDGVGTEPFTVQIRTVDVSGEPTTAILASTVAPDAPDGESLLNAGFATPATVVAGQLYAVAITRAVDNFSVFIRGDCAGSQWTSVDGVNWTDSTDDFIFNVFVTPPVTVATATCRGEQATHIGTDGDDEITGTPGRDVIAALGGGDEVSGLSGKDLICGGKGRDTLRGGKGQDKLFGQGGRDKLRGGGAKDRCVGGKKDDSAKKCEVEKSI